MTEILEQLEHKITQFHELSSLSHTIKDIHSITNFYLEAFSEAVAHSSLQPYQALNQENLYLLQEIRKKLIASRSPFERISLDYNFPQHNYQFYVDFYAQNKGTILECLNKDISSLELWATNFSCMERHISDHFTLDVLPHPSFSRAYLFAKNKIYLSEGKIILPVDCSEVKNIGYYVFGFDYSKNSPLSKSDEMIIPFNFKCKYRCRCGETVLEELQKKVKEDECLVLAKNTENYPLLETVLPILASKLRQEINLCWN